MLMSMPPPPLHTHRGGTGPLRVGMDGCGRRCAVPMEGMVGVGGRGGCQPLFQAQDVVDALHQADDNGLPGHQVAQPIQQLPVHDVRPLPGVTEHPLEIHLLFAIWTRLLLPHDAPTPDAELVEAGAWR